ncbi:MAG TPA: HAD family hydrolase [Rhizomicrobium sp.]|jgi:D-glycero-D-manno-heptose 1,7-bisphosphate phosphatase|nr:HAD family hydrolase [Rhizomicrobium sp.]
MTRAVFLDRDGVLNKAYIRDGKPYSPDTIGEMVIVPDAAAALARLHGHGFRLIMATNQPDIARGRLTRAQVDAMNGYVKSQLPLDGIEMCPHDDADRCDCRKPKPGMLLRAAAREGLDLSQSYMVGDRYRDIEAGHSASCRTILVGDGYGERFKAQPDATVATLSEAVDWILKQPVTKD